MTPIGVLALQGDVSEHEQALREVGASPVRVRRPADLDRLVGLILPGGESTTIGCLAAEAGLLEAVAAFAAQGYPLWGTCAGLILLAADPGRSQPSLGLLDVAVQRNAFGRQVDSFELDLEIRELAGGPFRAVFIRAPAVVRLGGGVRSLAELPGGPVVAVRQANILATSFHPELTSDRRLHRYFLGMLPAAVRQSAERGLSPLGRKSP